MIQRINNNYNVSNNYSKVKEVNCSDSKKGDEKVSEVILDKDTFEKSIPISASFLSVSGFTGVFFFF